MQEHEEGVTDVVVDVRHDVEEDQETPEKVVLDMIGHADQLNFVHHGAVEKLLKRTEPILHKLPAFCSLAVSSQLMS